MRGPGVLGLCVCVCVKHKTQNRAPWGGAGDTARKRRILEGGGTEGSVEEVPDKGADPTASGKFSSGSN